jgi:hypothetical protein
MRNDDEQRPEQRRSWWRRLDLKHNGRTFLRRRGLDNWKAFGLVVHRLDAPDPGMDLHDHPWPFVSLVLRGGYSEEWADARQACELAAAAEVHEWRPEDQGRLPRGDARSWRPGSIHAMPLNVAHRITSVEPGTVTLVLRGWKGRRWGFYQPTGWVDWEQYDYETRRGCTVESDRPEERR